jgi:hypothetical protein
MKTNAARIAHRASASRRTREEIMSKAAAALTESIESIKSAGGDDVDALIAESVRQCREWLAKNLGDLADAERGDEGDDDGGGTSDHYASKIADLLVEAGSFPDRRRALGHLLHHKDGRALLDRLHKGDTMSKEQDLEAILKDFGPIKTLQAHRRKGPWALLGARACGSA